MDGWMFFLNNNNNMPNFYLQPFDLDFNQALAPSGWLQDRSEIPPPAGIRQLRSKTCFYLSGVGIDSLMIWKKLRATWGHISSRGQQ